ncbi:hypothetical protein CGCSCA2_v007128 [Colletotrichum siamense]|uniref:Nucleoside phosphorylase domain-containing protein n=1 Tax=Colletotrichum siamense TaxID=690259 RepID=A0A9P5ES60_COLSI|nr:hypothetical protein CGCSCA2_v007128 [Colletotrichum siamense]
MATRSAAAAKPILSHDDYTVGWISALPLELAAARAMLDEEHPPLPPLSRQDDNIYTLGAIGKHNVVMACLPSGKMGNNSAAAIATQMRTTFPALRFGLMVGIGGGCPSAEHDIRLGDVVVSKPGKNDGGVIQYDFGLTDKEGRFVRNGVLNAPPTVLLNAVSATEAAHKLSKARIQNHLCAFELYTQKENKTQIALEYAYQALERGFHVFWVNCTTFKTLKSDYEVLLQIMMAKKRHDNEEDRTAVLRWLEDHENWVLIFDNAEDAKFPYGDWIPGSNGTPSQRRILFTTRDERLADAIANVKESVPLMDTTESVDLFNANHSQILRRTGEKDIIALVKRLGNLPLAITLASAYLREYPWITMEEYLELLQDFSERSKLFGYKPSFSNYNHSIMSIWEASFIKVQADNPRAADMLTVLGFLENDRIRFTDLEHASENMQMDKLNFLEDITTIRQSIGLLRSLALIYFDGKYLSLHPLVHQWLQARLSKHDLIASAIAALRVIYNASLTLIFPYNHDCLPINSKWYGHARFALRAVEQQSVAQFEVHEECYLLIICLLSAQARTQAR